jgi:hypothetical protein
MTRLMTYTAVIVLAATAALGLGNRGANSNANGEGTFASDGAFRDGLYLGQLAATSGRAMHPAIGRWSTEQDRANFALGYSRGYERSAAVVATR